MNRSARLVLKQISGFAYLQFVRWCSGNLQATDSIGDRTFLKTSKFHARRLYHMLDMKRLVRH